jgi:hypothetical protein
VLSVTGHLGGVSVHHERVPGAIGLRAFPWKVVVGLRVAPDGRRVPGDIDPDVRDRVAGVERSDSGHEGGHHHIARAQCREVQPELGRGRREVDNGVFGQRRLQQRGITEVQARGVPVKRVGDLGPVVDLPDGPLFEAGCCHGFLQCFA